MAIRLRALSRDDRLVEQRRKVIMEAAIGVFAQKSYAEATVQEIADAAGMTVGNVYRYIGSKQDILHLFCLEAKASIEDTRHILTGLNTGNASQALRQTMKAYVEGTDKLGTRIIFYNREIRNFSHEDRATLLQSQVDHIQFFEDLIRKGIASGEFKTDNPLLLAHNIVLIPHDWLLRGWFLTKRFTLQEYINVQTDIIMKSLVTQCNCEPEARSGSSKRANRRLR